MQMIAIAKAPTLMKPTMRGGDAPPVSTDPDWGVLAEVGAEESVSVDADIADVVPFPDIGPGGKDIVHGCREVAGCMAQRVGRVRLRALTKGLIRRFWPCRAWPSLHPFTQ
jgi:hypothetical protein